MSAVSPIHDSCLVVRAPHAQPSVRYRAYAERLGSGSVLDWIVERLQASGPPDLTIVCTCDTASELAPLADAFGLARPVRFMDVGGRGELQSCRYVMDKCHLHRLVVAGFSHALAPDGMLSNLLGLHLALGADLTDVTGGTFAEPCFVIESSFVDELLNVEAPRTPNLVFPAAALLREMRSREPGVEREFQWLHLDLAKRCQMEPSRWPETISIQSARDVDVLRTALDESVESPRPTGQTSSLIDSWKSAAIGTRQRRMMLANVRPSRTNVSPTRRRVRVLYASNSSGFTGAQQSLCHLIGAIDIKRYEPFALVSYSGTFTDELRRRGVHVICPDESIADRNIESVAFAKQVLEEYAPNIVHANHDIGLPLVTTAMSLGIPLVQHVRVQTPHDLLQHMCAADVIVAVSDFVKKRISAFDIDPNKVEVIFNGVDVSEFKPDPEDREPARERLGVPNDEFVVTMIARMARNKRHDTVIDAMNRLRRSSGRGHLILVGSLDGDGAYQQSVYALLKQEALVGHVSLIEFTADIKSVLHASDVVTIPSEDEPLSRAALEAMATGVPVIVGDSGGTKEVIDPGVTGLVVPCGNSERLAADLYDLAHDPKQRRRIGMAAAEKVRMSLTARHCSERTMSLYERLLDGHYALSATKESRVFPLWRCATN